MTIKNLLFDLGGVLYQIDYSKVSNALNQLNPNLLFSQLQQHPIFDQFEIGAITPQEFRTKLNQLLQKQLSESEIDTIWNSMLIGLFPDRLELIEVLSARYPIALLSNANAIHYDYILPECEPIFKHFYKIFFSFEIGKRKPHPETFQWVLQQLQWKPEETLFIEDSPQHIHGAKQVGIQTLFLQDPHTLNQQLQQLLAF